MIVMTNRASKILLAMALIAGPALAQELATGVPMGAPKTAGNAVGSSDTGTIVLAPAPRDYSPPAHVDSDGETRTISAGLAAALSQGMPKYKAPTPTPTPVVDPVDLRDVDKPKNEIKRLPKYVVQESRPPVFRERDLYTTQGQIDLAFKNHSGLLFGNILGLNSGAAQMMYLEDQRLDNIDDLKDEAHAMARGGAASEGSYILQQSSDTYMRSGTGWDWSGGGIVGGNNK
ncbi:MAG TPA: hypothetical protein VFE25_13505 [Opitutaceae bacterium]|nr:hypothetical protein [Opitutaceae bacterium]